MLLASSASCSVAELTSGGPPLDATAPDAALQHEADSLEAGSGDGADVGAGERGDAKGGGSDARGSFDVALDASSWPAPTGFVTLENALNQRYLDVSSMSRSSGAQVWTWSYTGGTNQYWTFMPAGDGSYEIINENSDQCLDDVLGVDGTGMEQDTCSAGANSSQRWYLVDYQDSLLIVGERSGKCLNSTADMDGATVYLWDCSPNQSEQWIISH